MGTGPGRAESSRWWRGTSGRVVASAVVASALVLGLLGVDALLDPAPGRPQPATSTVPVPAPTVTGPGSLGLGRAAPSIARPPSAPAVRSLLRTRARAVLERDAVGWSGTVDPAEDALGAAQQALFDRLALLPLSRWDYAPWPGAGEGSVDAVAGTRTLRVRLTYALAGFDTAPVVREQILTAVTGPDGRARVSATASVGVVDIWDLGDIEVGVGSRVLVLSRAGAASGLLTPDALAVDAGTAVARVGARWPVPWPGRVVLVLPADEAEMARVLGRGAGGLDQLAAVTTGAPGARDGTATSGDRVVVNPQAYAGLGAAARRVVLTHESVHVATRAAGGGPVPLWLSEGFADEVALSSEGIGYDVAARPLLDAVRSGTLPADLPSDGAFDASAGPLGTAYEQAWTACRLIVDLRGADGLVAFYRAVQRVGEARAFAETLSMSRAGFLVRWREALRSAAGPALLGG